MQTLNELRRSLLNGGLSGKLSELYGHDGAFPQIKRYSALLDGFQRAFSVADDAEAALFSAPGRTEIIGNHTDHQGGRVLAATVSLDMAAAARPRTDGVVRILSDGYAPLTLSIAERDPVPSERNTSAALVRGISAYLAAHGYAVGGFDALIRSDVPEGSGLSSSAAYGILIGTIFTGFSKNTAVSPLTLALAAKHAENRYFGKPSGLMDQLACATGGFVGIDFHDPDLPHIKRVDCDPEALGYAVCIVNAGGNHANLTDEYGKIPGEMRQAAEYFGKDVLSEVEPSVFYDAIPAMRGAVSDRAILRSMHFFSENARVLDALEALECGDMHRFLMMISASGRSSMELLQNICPPDPSERSVALALAVSEQFLNGRGAARIHGGGFAGTIQAWVPLTDLDAYRAEMERIFGAGVCYRLRIRNAGGMKL